MRFLADESCDFAVVQALRAAGHDVVAIAEVSPRLDDEIVIRQAVREERILITEDKDFGQLVYASHQKTSGVIFFRYPFSTREKISKEIVKLVSSRREKLSGCFVVVQPGRIRISRTPQKDK